MFVIEDAICVIHLIYMLESLTPNPLMHLSVFIGNKMYSFQVTSEVILRPEVDGLVFH